MQTKYQKSAPEPSTSFNEGDTAISEAMGAFKASVSKPDPPRFRFSPWVSGLLVLCALVLGYWMGLAHPWKAKTASSVSLLPADAVSLPDFAIPLKPGPWGNMEYQPIYIEPPEEYLDVNKIEQCDRRWRFAGMSVEQLTALFHKADLTETQRAELLNTNSWQLSDEAIYVNPSKELVLSISPLARKQIYSNFTSDPKSLYQNMLCSFPAAKFDEYFSQTGLPDDAIALVKQLSYPHGNLQCICDIPMILDALPTPSQKMKMLKLLFRKPTLILRLHITPDSDLDELEHYWIKAGWGVDLRPLMESLAKLSGGARVDLVELLPPIPSANIYTFPFPSFDPNAAKMDCHWTALNFFRETPDNRLTDTKYTEQVLQNDYYPVDTDPRYGDLILLKKPNGDVIHSSVYIADDIVYTKNSANFYDPYILMTIPDMMDHFSMLTPEDQPLSMQILRNKYY